MNPRHWAARWLFVALLGGLALAGAARSPAGAQPSRASELVAAVNAYRARLGLPALEMHPSLMAAAQGHVAWMAANYTYSHTGAGGSSPTDRARAAGYPAGSVFENVEGGTSLTPDEAVQWWDRSGVHQTTMRLPDHVHIGAGYAENGEQQLYVLLIARPSSQPARPPAPDRPTEQQPAGDAGQSAEEPVVVTGPPAVPLTRAQPRADGAVIHVLQAGQSLWDVAAVYGVSVDDLLRLNGLRRGAVVFPGAEIVVQAGQGLAPTPQLVHTVQQGETPWTVAALHGLTLDELLNLNGLTRGDVVKVGDELYIRDPNPTPTEVRLPTRTPTPEASATAPPSATPATADAPTSTPPPTETPPPAPPVAPSATVTPLVPPPSETPAAVAVAQALPTAVGPVHVPAAAPPADADDSSDTLLIAAMLAIAGLGLALAAGGLWVAVKSR